MTFHDLNEIANKLIDQYRFSNGVWLKPEYHHFSVNHEFLSYIELLDENEKVFSIYFDEDEQPVIYSYEFDIEDSPEDYDIELEQPEEDDFDY